MGGRSLDDLQSPNDRRADFLCLRGLLAVEIKSLEDPGTERMENLLRELRARPDWPMFLGSAPMESFIRNTKNPSEVRREVLERIGAGIIRHLRKANRQLQAHTKNFPRKNLVRVLILVNEDKEVYDPHTVGYVLWHAVRHFEAGRPRYANVDGILYLTERHASVRGDKLTFPVVMIEGPSVEDSPWKSSVLEFIADRWGASSYDENCLGDGVENFTAIDHIPDVAQA